VLTKHLYLIILTVIIFFGFFIRTYRLSELPSGFFADEASIGYNAYTILTKGTDEYGTPYPIFFRAFGEYKSPIQIYTTVPFIALFGLNEFAVRLPSAIFGTLTILAIYLLTKELFTHHKKHGFIGILAAFFLAISPWHIHLSRVAFELMPFVFFTTLGIYLFLKAQHKSIFFYFSIVSFTLALYSYFPARIFIPLFCLGIIIVYCKFFLQNKKIIFLSFFLLLILLIPFLQYTFSPVGFARWNQVNIFSQPQNNQSIPAHIINNYISHFSFDFLFLKGDIGMPGQFITRHSVRGIGELYLFQLPLILLCIFFLWKKRESRILFLLSVWLVLYPIGSMFTTDQSAQATRSIIGIIPLQIFSAVGLWWIMNLLKCFETLKRIHFFNLFSRGIIIIIIFISFFNFVNLYFVEYPLYSSDFWGWQYGARDIVQYFALQEKNYDELIMAPEFNAPEIFFKFYALNTCIKCRVGLSENSYKPRRKQLFAVTPTYLQNNPVYQLKVIKTIFYPNNTIAFQIGEIVQ